MAHEVVVLAHHFDMTAAETRRENARLIAEQLGGAASAQSAIANQKHNRQYRRFFFA